MERLEKISFRLRRRQKAVRPKPATSTSREDSARTLEVIRHATEDLRQCPNRIWSVTKNLPGGSENIPRLFSSEHVMRLLPRAGENHNQCSYELCELSQRNFTSVEQRHEGCLSRHDCRQLEDHFPSQLLNQAAEDGDCTAWKLSGKSLVRFPQSYVAISHVWSDGTGAGAWPEKGVNRCLWFFFMNVAKSLQVSGIWWDTVSIPKARAARSKAINRMHCNYEDATVTLVHDCFLRDFEWDDGNPKVSAEIASLAILMSPWFSRGWTALELAKSSKVKVLFKKRHGYVLKDLDNDILSPFENPSGAHLTAIKAIGSLRKGTVAEVNDLLIVLGPRYTSWSRDMAVIAGILTGVELLDTDSQRDIYQKILKKMAKICHGHLFHNSATMSKGFSWCPANILSMPSCPKRPLLQVAEGGNVVGVWKALQVSKISQAVFVWAGIHPLTEVGLRSAVKDPGRHLFLVEPDVEIVSRALLVKVIGRHRSSQIICGQLIGFLPFSPPQQVSRKAFVYTEVSLGVNEHVKEDDITEAWGLVKSFQSEWHHQGHDKHVRQEAVSNSKEVQPQGYPRVVIGTSPEEQKGLDLLHAAGEGDEQRTQLLLKEKADVNFQNKYGWTALHCAVWRGHEAIVKILMSQEINPLLEDVIGQPPLHLAAMRGRYDIAKILTDTETMARAVCTSAKQTVLHRGAWSGSSKVVRLLGPGLDLNAVDEDGLTALHVAARQSCLPVVKLLLEWNADPNVQDKKGSTPLSCAARSGDEEIVSLLLEVEHIQIDLADRLGRTPFVMAARYGHEHIVRIFLEHSETSIGTTDCFGRSPVFHAAAYGHTDVAQLLCERSQGGLFGQTFRVLEPKDVFRDNCRAIFEMFYAENPLVMVGNPQDRYCFLSEENEKENPLIRATYLCQSEAVEFLLEHGVYADSKEEIRRYRDTEKTIILYDAQTALQVAIMNKDEISVSLLLESGEVDVNYHEEFTFPPLFLAVLRGHETLTAMLLETEDIDVNMRDPFGDSILVRAAEGGNMAIVERLLACGKLDINFHDRLGMTPLANAAKKGFSDVVNLLLSKDDINVELPGLFRSPLSHASENGHEAVVRLLLGTKKVDVDSIGISGQTPLMHASENGHSSVVKLLLDNGEADVTVRGITGDTALSLAARNGHSAVTKLLLERARTLQADGRNEVATSAMHYAAQHGFVAVMRQLLGMGENVDLDTQDEHLRTPLSYAAERGKASFVKELLTAGTDVDVNSQDEFLRTPLSYAAEHGRSGVVSELLAIDEQLDVNLEDAMGYTPLFYAFIIGENPLVVAQLLSTGKAQLGSGCPGDAVTALENYSNTLILLYPTLFLASPT